MDPNLSNVDFRDFWHLAPAIVLSVWGLVVLLADLALAGRMSAPARRRAIGWLTLAGVALALLAAAGLIQVQQLAKAETQGTPGWLSPSLAEYFSRAGGAIFLGTLSADLQTGVLNVLFILMLGLVVWQSMAWSFTEDWGEYFALVTWATVGMMLLAASEEL
ncbi:MAG: NADH-quinone oxidoreductase subunit N, partial [Isosphaeraceae bacterium]